MTAMSVIDPRPVVPVDAIDATVPIPGSKSITNRALLCAALAEGSSVIEHALRADDTEAMASALGALGISLEWGTDDTIRVGGGPIGEQATDIDARQSGTTSRFLLPVLTLDGTARRLDGDAQLRDRPMGPSFEALRFLGATVTPAGRPGHLPVIVRGPITGDTVEVTGDVSSQFLSGLLLAGPSMAKGLRLRVTTTLVSRPYVDMTVAVMRAFGAEVTDDVDEWVVEPRPYGGTRYRVEPDASAASYAFAAAVLTGGRVTVEGLHRGSLQGDVAFAEVLARMGAAVTWHDDAVTVAAGEVLHGVDVDMEHVSDTVPTLAVLAARADGPTRIRNVGFIRHKECDRIAAPVAELRRAGITASETDDGMVIEPGPVSPATFDSYGDHRMAMAFALLGLVVPGVSVRDPHCVAKTFPGFWDMLDALAGRAFAPARGV